MVVSVNKIPPNSCCRYSRRHPALQIQNNRYTTAFVDIKFGRMGVTVSDTAPPWITYRSTWYHISYYQVWHIWASHIGKAHIAMSNEFVPKNEHAVLKGLRRRWSPGVQPGYLRFVDESHRAAFPVPGVKLHGNLPPVGEESLDLLTFFAFRRRKNGSMEL